MKRTRSQRRMATIQQSEGHRVLDGLVGRLLPLSRSLLYLLPAAVWIGLITWASGKPSSELQEIPFATLGPLDFETIAFHGPGFAILALLMAPAIMMMLQTNKRAKPPLFAVTAIVLVAGTLVGVANEIHHAFVPYRSAYTSDLIADVGGIVLGLTIFSWTTLVLRSDNG